MADSVDKNDNTVVCANNVDQSEKIKLESNEGGVFDCKLEAIQMSGTIKNMMDSTVHDPNRAVPLKNDAVTNEALKKIIEWVEYHYDDPPIDEDFDDEKERRSEELSHWDKQFIDVPDLGLLYDIVVSANFLEIKGLVEVCGKHICSKIKGKKCSEVREILNIRNDFTQEEEDAIHKENEWIYAKD